MILLLDLSNLKVKLLIKLTVRTLMHYVKWKPQLQALKHLNKTKNILSKNKKKKVMTKNTKKMVLTKKMQKKNSL